MRTKAFGYPTRTVSWSTVGSENPADCSRLPQSATCAEGDVWIDCPPCQRRATTGGRVSETASGRQKDEEEGTPEK